MRKNQDQKMISRLSPLRHNYSCLNKYFAYLKNILCGIFSLEVVPVNSKWFSFKCQQKEHHTQLCSYFILKLGTLSVSLYPHLLMFILKICLKLSLNNKLLNLCKSLYVYVCSCFNHELVCMICFVVTKVLCTLPVRIKFQNVLVLLPAHH